MTHTFKVGDLVEIVDHSDAHGDVGRIWVIQDNGIITVELEECVWPVRADEIRTISGNNREAACTLTTGVVSSAALMTPPLCFTNTVRVVLIQHHGHKYSPHDRVKYSHLIASTETPPPYTRVKTLCGLSRLMYFAQIDRLGGLRLCARCEKIAKQNELSDLGS